MNTADKLITIAENEQRVYKAGYAKGKAEGGNTEEAYNEGFEAGQKSEYDRFWDNYQQNGQRTNYQNAFSGKGWTVETFKPKYDITSNESYMLFRASGIVGDLGEILKTLGRKLTIRGNISYGFNTSEFEIIDGIEFSGVLTNMDAAFSNSLKLREIKTPLLIDANTSINGFASCYALEELRFDGTIGKNGLNLQWSPKLSKSSIVNIIGCLSTTTSGLSVTVSKTAVNNAFETSEGAGDGSTSQEWLNLTATKPNWTISLV